jgi:hypothetical protein
VGGWGRRVREWAGLPSCWWAAATTGCQPDSCEQLPRLAAKAGGARWPTWLLNTPAGASVLKLVSGLTRGSCPPYSMTWVVRVRGWWMSAAMHASQPPASPRVFSRGRKRIRDGAPWPPHLVDAPQQGQLLHQLGPAAVAVQAHAHESAASQGARVRVLGSPTACQKRNICPADRLPISEASPVFVYRVECEPVAKEADAGDAVGHLGGSCAQGGGVWGSRAQWSRAPVLGVSS